VVQDDRYALRRGQGGDGVCDGIDGQVTFNMLAGVVAGVAEFAEPFVVDFGRVKCTGARGVGLACDNDFRL